MSTGGIVGGIVGAVVGFVATGFNPVGAAYGFALGLAAGSLLDPPKGPTVAGPTIQDTAVQTSTYGVPIPRVYGTIGGAGNILWVENNKLKATIRKKKSGGKGGGGSSATTKTVTYSATFILGLCEGPIVGVRRIWCSDKLIYNAASTDPDTIVASNNNAIGFRIYTGADDQMPDPRYEADVGVGNAPAFRGLAYIAFDDFQLADFSNTLQAAQFKVEVVGSGTNSIASGTATISTAIKSWDSMARSNSGLVMAVAQSTTAGATTLNGQSWTPITLPDSWAWNDVVWAGSFFSVTAPSAHCLTSKDGKVWLSGTLPRVTTWREKAYNGSKICVISTNNIYTAISSDGLTWEEGALPTSRTWRGCAFGVGIFITVASGSDKCAISSDGLSWVEHTLPLSSNWIGVEFNGVYFLTVSSIPGVNFLISTDGIAWSQVTNPHLTATWNALTASGSNFHVISNGLGGFSRLASSSNGLDWTVASTPTGTWTGLIADGNLVYGVRTGTTSFFAYPSISTSNVPLADMIEAEVDLSTLLTSADIDTTSLTSGVRGYRVSGGALRAALEPLQGAFPFDIRESGYGLKCVPRGQASVMTIPETDLGATDADTPGDSILQSREMDSQLPARTVISYFDSAREYAISEQYAERLNTEAINRVDRDLPLVLTANEAAGVAEVLQFLPWLERTEAAIVLPPTYLALEPADVVTVTTTAATYELRLIEVNYTPEGRLECKARPNRAALYSTNALGGEGVAPDGTIGLAGPSDYALLDIPVVDEGLQNAPGLSVAMTGLTASWPGGVLFRSADSGQTWTDLQAFPFKGTFGTTSAPMPARSGSLLDRGSSLIVSLLSGTLESITESAMLNGANFAAYGANGRWEIIRFANAVLNGDGTYTLSVFWRGDRGTEQYTGTHVTGDTFVLLDDPDNAFIGYPTALIGSPQTYRAVTTGASIDSDSDLAFTYAGINLECYSGVHPKGVRDTSLNLTISWKRRTRVGGEWRDSVDASLGETTEAYEVDIMQGAVVKRTITSTTSSVSYTAAQQTTDFGSAQASVLVRIYQLSSAVGRGYPLEATL